MKVSGTYLERILERTKADLAPRQKQKPLLILRALAKAAPKPPPFEQTLRRASTLRIIPELKRKSHGPGFIDRDLDVAATARDYAVGGAAALSVLTEGPNFAGSIEDLSRARQGSKLPLLRSDFVIDEYQLVESRVNGASAVLLIAAALEGSQLGEFLRLGRELGLDAVVEVHDAPELERALDSGASMVSVGNRDLATLKADFATAEALAPVAARSGVFVVTSGGIQTPADVQRLARAGAEAFIVGEALLRSANRVEAVRTFSRSRAP